MKGHQSLVLFYTLTVILLFWIIWAAFSTTSLTSQQVFGPRLVSLKNQFPDIIYDLEVDDSVFEIEGFRYYFKLPFSKKSLLHYTRLWILRRGIPEGRITVRGIQELIPKAYRKPNIPGDVTLWVRFHLSDPNDDNLTRLRIVATDWKSESQTTEDLVQRGSSYCRKISFLGPIKTVVLEAFLEDPKHYVIIDELKIGIGNMKIWDNEGELECL